MLPDTSSITMRRTGWGVLSNNVIGCGFPSSRISKSFSPERDQATVSVRDRHEHADGVARAAESWLLSCECAQIENARRDDRNGEEPSHTHFSIICRRHLASSHTTSDESPTLTHVLGRIVEKSELTAGRSYAHARHKSIALSVVTCGHSFQVISMPAQAASARIDVTDRIRCEFVEMRGFLTNG